MSGFSLEWLALREPHDARARNPGIVDAVAASLAGKSSIRVVDLACGSGSTLRALAKRFPVPQRWRLVDNDERLLAHAAAIAPPAGVTMETIALDLDRGLDSALDGPIDLVTASALLDLVSQSWLDRLAARLAQRSIPIYAALNYDGRVAPGALHALDAAVVAALKAHQRRDKGFGPALGPTAAPAAISRLQSLGYSVVQGEADWTIGPGDRQVQSELFSGWAEAARETGELAPAALEDWLVVHRERIAAGRSSLRVGHIDFFAWPTGNRRPARSRSNRTSSPRG